MTFSERKRDETRTPICVLSLSLDRCSLTSGVAPCGATDPAGGECFNTLATCPVPQDYQNTARTYQFYSKGPAVVGLDGIANVDIYGIRHTPPTVIPGDFGSRASVSVPISTWHDNDIGFDPYVATRPYDPETQGDGLSKFLARNLYYFGRPMTLSEGFLSDGYDEINFQVRNYVVDRIDRRRSGAAVVVGKDPLRLAASKSARVPPETTGELQAAINASSVDVRVDVATAPQYQSYQYLRIDDEVIEFTYAANGIFNIVSRAQAGTSQVDHSAQSGVQAVWHFEGHPYDAIKELLAFTEIDPAFIPVSDWDDERDNNLPGFEVETYLTAPNGVEKLLRELLLQTWSAMWWDELSQQIKLRRMSPYIPTDIVIGPDQLLPDSVTVEDQPSKRKSRVVVYYGVKDYTKPLKAGNYTRPPRAIVDLAAEDALRFGEALTEVIHSRWYTDQHGAFVDAFAQNILDQYANVPKTVSFELSVRDSDLKAGQVVELSTRQIQGADGSIQPTRFQITQARMTSVAHRYRYSGLVFPAGSDSANIVTVPRQELDVWLFLGQPTDPGEYVIELPAGITVYSATPGVPAITGGGFNPATQNLVVRISGGQAMGLGGLGGSGADTHAIWVDDGDVQAWNISNGAPADGSDGTDAFFATCDTEFEISNGGNLWGAGGGEGGKNGFAQPNEARGGDGGGSGASFLTRPGGRAGLGRLIDQQGNQTDTFGKNGSQGDTQGPGDAAGDWGQPGGAGDATGGAGGYAIRANGHTISFQGATLAALQASGQIRGQVG